MTSLLLGDGWQCLQPCVRVLLPQQIRRLPSTFVLPAITQGTRQHTHAENIAKWLSSFLAPSLFLTAFLHPKHVLKGPLKDRRYIVLRTTLPINFFFFTRLERLHSLPLGRLFPRRLPSPTCKQGCPAGPAVLWS